MNSASRYLICYLITALWVASAPHQLTAQTSAPAAKDVPDISWQEAGDYIGREVSVAGRVVMAARSKLGHVFLNFDRDYRNTLTIFIRNSDCKKFSFSPQKMYNDKYIRVQGRVHEYQSCPNINITAPQQIHILLEPPEKPVTRLTRPGRQPSSASAVGSKERPSSATAPAPASGPTTTRPVHSVRPERKRIIKIASYNVKNLFDAFDDPYHTDSPEDAKSAAEQATLAKAIHRLDADVLALMEIENRGCLDQFVDQYLPDFGYEHVVHVEGNSRRGIDVALLSRLPVGVVKSHRHLRGPDNRHTFTRDLLQVRIEPSDGDAFDVFVLHYMSKTGSQISEATRLAEARLTRRVLDDVLEKNAETDFVVCGDFNDLLDSKTLDIVRGGGATALIGFVQRENLVERYTYNRSPWKAMIDFILVSPAMAQRYIPGSYQIPHGQLFLKASDHYPVTAEFELE
jgi:endonuclease/exonuclease/phosphatase family metal-dependent hydrolase